MTKVSRNVRVDSERPWIGMRTVVIAALSATGLLLSASPIGAMTERIHGTAGGDRLIGTSGADLILGLGGDDDLRAKAGEDRLVGGPGDDLLNGGPDRDTYVCGPGFDVVVSDYPRHPDEHVGEGCEAVIFEA
jgi:Ca2+-binding RTX toxin-like protein